MPVRRRPLLLLAASSALMVLGVVACSQNEVTAPGLDSEILVENAGPQGTAPPVLGAFAWAVNTIDSILFTDDIDSTRLDVTTLRVTDPQGQPVAGTVRFVQGRAYIFYTQAFPSAAYDFEIKDAPLPSTLGKVYFIPAQPLHEPHRVHRPDVERDPDDEGHARARRVRVQVRDRGGATGGGGVDFSIDLLRRVRRSR